MVASTLCYHNALRALHLHSDVGFKYCPFVSSLNLLPFTPLFTYSFHIVFCDSILIRFVSVFVPTKTFYFNVFVLNLITIVEVGLWEYEILWNHVVVVTQ